MKKTAMLLFVFGILTGCNRSPVVDIRAEADVINKIEDEWTAAIISKDIDKIMSIFAQEAVVMNAYAPAFIGIQSIRKSLESWFSDITISHDTFVSAIDTIEVSSAGDLAYVRGNSRLTISTPGGVVEETDKWITIYRQINGEWKAIVDIWNSDMPILPE